MSSTGMRQQLSMRKLGGAISPKGFGMATVHPRVGEFLCRPSGTRFRFLSQDLRPGLTNSAPPGWAVRDLRLYRNLEVAGLSGAGLKRRSSYKWRDAEPVPVHPRYVVWGGTFVRPCITSVCLSLVTRVTELHDNDFGRIPPSSLSAMSSERRGGEIERAGPSILDLCFRSGHAGLLEYCMQS